MEHSESRRDFVKQSVLAGSMLTALDPGTAIAQHISTFGNEPKQPWYRTVTRWGQVNITERDPERYDIGWWRTQWKKTETQGVIINAGGIVAYYPTKIPFHKQAQYLNGRDLFGELCKAAHDDGLVVFARMDSNRAHQEFYDQYPGWFAVDKEGKPYRAGDLYLSCINSPYYDAHIPAILTEIAMLYRPEGFTDNSWSGLTRDQICYCNYCQKNFREKTGNEIPQQKNWNDKTYREWIKWNYTRRIEIWELNNKATKAAGGADCTWAGMNSGSIRGQGIYFRDYNEICKRADILMLDDQTRSNEGGFQHNAQTGNLIHGLLGWDKLVPESMAMYQNGGGTNFRLASKVQPEARMWMISGIAGGIQPWWHHVSAFHEDKRMHSTAAPVMKWHKDNEQYLINRLPIANVGVVWSQQNTDFFGRDDADELVEEPWRGMTNALMRARIPYLPVHIDHITRDAANFKLLILPNIGAMSDVQVNAVRQFVKNGGSIIATGETSLYNEWGDKRENFALADLFGAHYLGGGTKPETKVAGNAYHTYLRLDKNIGSRHKILEGFEETEIIPFGGWLQKVKVDADAEVPLTYVPQFPVYPPETAWMREPVTTIPGVVIKNNAGGGKVIFVPADMDRQYDVNNLPDHANLVKNMVNWVTGDQQLLSVEGPGLVDVHLYQQPKRLVMHVVNLTSAGTWRQPVEEYIPVGPLNIKIRLPKAISGKSIALKVTNQQISASSADLSHSRQSRSVRDDNAPTSKDWISFTLTSVLDHELIIIS